MPEVNADIDEHVATLTIDRPPRNLVSYGVLDELIRLFTEVEADDDVRAVIFTATGPFFCAGSDLTPGGGGLDASSATFTPLRGGGRDVGGELSLKLFASTKPVIAAMNGTAVGIGVSMVLPMDVRIGAQDARFGLPFTRRGIIPESCATWFLPRIVGIAKATEWTLTGRIFSADEALAAGLMNELVPADEVLVRAREVAREIAVNVAPVSAALTRQLLWRQLGSPHPMSANRLESAALLARGTSPDIAEGVRAFREKRLPNFALTAPRDLPAFYPWFTDEEFEPRAD